MPDPGVRRLGRADRASAREPALIDPILIRAVGELIARTERPGHVPLIGISGAQGCGKTTLARAAAEAFGAAHLSLDDVYLTRTERAAMAESVHPLFAVRGPPGTHDLTLLARTAAALRAAGPDDRTLLPAFDKRMDDRRPVADWPAFRGRPRAILVDGWCLGARPEVEARLSAPINALEADRDPDGRWRRAVNDRLLRDYDVLFAGLDAVLFLKAPSFDVVLDWRCEQESHLLGLAPDTLPDADRARIAGFIQYFERLTRNMLDGGAACTAVVQLDRNRRPVAAR